MMRMRGFVTAVATAAIVGASLVRAQPAAERGVA